MSHSRYVTVLAHHQPLGSTRGSSLPADVADLLVQRMVAERISQKVIRMFSPDSIFAATKFSSEARCYIPDKLPPAEVEGTYFQPPESANDATSAVPRLRYLPRYREVFGDQQLAASL